MREGQVNLSRSILPIWPCHRPHGRGYSRRLTCRATDYHLRVILSVLLLDKDAVSFTAPVGPRTYVHSLASTLCVSRYMAVVVYALAYVLSPCGARDCAGRMAGGCSGCIHPLAGHVRRLRCLHRWDDCPGLSPMQGAWLSASPWECQSTRVLGAVRSRYSVTPGSRSRGGAYVGPSLSADLIVTSLLILF